MYRNNCSQLVVSVVILFSVQLIKKVELVGESVHPDSEHWNNVLPKIIHIWRYCVFPQILGRWYTLKRDLNLLFPEGCVSAAQFTRGLSVVSCSNRACPISEFHLSCLQITNIPNHWLGPLCPLSSTSSNPNKRVVYKELCS